MRWLRFTHQGQPAWGCLNNDTISVHTGDLFGIHQPTGQTLLLSQVSLLSPCQPGKFFALWNNFRAAAAKNQWAEPTEPLYFLKAANSFSHSGAEVMRPRSEVGRIIFEAELGVVIGRRGRDIPLDRAHEHVFGYTCVNDVTAFELLRADTSFEQWTRCKSFDGFTPFGPWIETDLDPSQCSVRGVLNGRERQNYPVSDMFFSPLELVSRLSRDVTLEPGDVISCGTSLGAAPWPNDATVEVTIDGIGTLSNTMKACS
jgi:2-keto-4-pentenoate hydratase/2-oxohepta-3-ene-1,7-dioic acid hydratase in catechol pathway